MDKYRIIRAMGIEVLTSLTLTANSAMVRGETIALVRPDLEDHEHDEAVDYLLGQAVAAACQARP